MTASPGITDMKKKTIRRVRWASKLTVVVAAAPLFQFSQCITFNSQVGQTVLNGLPNLFFSTLQSIFLFPIQALLSGGGTTMI